MMKHGLTVTVNDEREFTELFQQKPSQEDFLIMRQLLFKKLKHSGRLDKKESHFQVIIREASDTEIAEENQKIDQLQHCFEEH